MHLTSPNPIAQDLAATPIGQVVEKSFVEKYGPRIRHDARQDDVQRPLQAGAVRQGRPDHPHAVPNYWDTAHQPKIKSITFSTVNDAEALIAGLRSGSINGTFDLPARDALSLSGDSSLKVNYVPYGGDVNYLSPNVEKGPFKNPLVREAFNLAIPRSALATAVDGKYGRPLDLVETPALFTDHQSQYMSAYNALGSSEQPEPH